MSSLRWALIQWKGPFKKRRIGYQQAPREVHAKKQGKTHLWAKQRGHSRDQLCWQLDLGHPASRTGASELEPTSSVVLCNGSPSKLKHLICYYFSFKSIAVSVWILYDFKPLKLMKLVLLPSYIGKYFVSSQRCI